MFGLLDRLSEWRMRREVLSDVRRRRGDAREWDYFKVKDGLTEAIQALSRGEKPHADLLWKSLLRQYPQEARESKLALEVLIGLGRFDEAEELMSAGQKKRPGDPRFAVGLGEISQAKRDHDTAAKRWAFVRKRFPGVVEGYTAGASALSERGELDQAEALALRAIKQFPDLIGGHLEYARIAVRREDWEEALRRWEPIRDKFGYFGGYVGSAQALTRLGRYDEAEKLLQESRYRFGMDPGPLSELARVAEARGDIAEAVERWKGVLYRFPLDMNVHFSVAEAFERLGAPAEAEAALRAAIDRFPTELRPMRELAMFFNYKRHDFNAAARAWAAIRDILPDSEEAYIRGAEALRQAKLPEEADALAKEHHTRFKSA